MPANNPEEFDPSLVEHDAESGIVAIAALAEPARRALYRYVVAQAEPVSREQAATGAGVARHVAKFHLDKLVDDGLLDFGYRRPPGRRGPGAGRPAKVYRRSRREVSVSLPERRYQLAGALLAEAVTDAQRDALPVEVALRRIAHQAGRDLAETARRRVGEARADTARRDAVVDVLAECGYEPRRGPDGVSLVNCPFHSLARRYTDLVCGMNLDVLQGVLEGLEPTGLEALLDPAPGRCCVRLSETNGVAPGETLKAGSTSDR